MLWAWRNGENNNMKYQIQYREKGGKRYYNFSHRKLKNVTEGRKMIARARKMQPKRTFRLRVK